MKDIVIIANFCGDLLGERNNRFVYLAELLAKGHAAELITSDFNHGAKRHREAVVNALAPAGGDASPGGQKSA